MASKTVLVIDDNELNLKLMLAILETGNYLGLEAADAATGIQLAMKHKPDLILMDIGLPDMDGITATRELKKTDETSGIPVVAVTGYNIAEIEKKIVTAGFSGFVAKPIDVKKFLGTIKALI